VLNVEQRDGVTVVALAHGKASVMDLEFCRAISACFTELQESGDRGAVVLTGRGSIFSAGVDLRRFLDGGTDYISEFYPALNDCFRAVWALDRPLVTAINGHAVAGGCMLAAASDLRLMAEGTGRIGVPELLVGVPFPPLVFEILRAVVPSQNLRTIAFLGQSYTPAVAVTMGLIDEVVPAEQLLADACVAATRLGAIPPESFVLNKRQLRKHTLDWLAANPDLDEACFATWKSDEVRAAVQTYVETTLGSP
jgi:enoyl-CoA hydratase